MELELPFEYYNDQIGVKENKESNPYIEEFKKGDFSNLLLQNIYSSQEEISDILLKSDDTLPEVKIAILKKMVYAFKYINVYINQKGEKIEADPIEAIRANNDRVRELLKQLFEKEDKNKLKERWLEKCWKYNNFYWKKFWGKSFSDKTEIEFWLDNSHIKKQLQAEKKKYIEKCIRYLLLSNIPNIESMLEIYGNIFCEEECGEVVKNMDLSKEQKEFILNYI